MVLLSQVEMPTRYRAGAFRSRAIMSRGKFIPLVRWDNVGSGRVCCNHEKNVILVVHGLSEEQ